MPGRGNDNRPNQILSGGQSVISRPRTEQKLDLFDKQVDFITDRDTPILGYIGGWGSAKTTAGVFKCVVRCQENGEERGIVVREDYPKLQSVLHLFFQRFPRTRKWYNVEHKEMRFPNGAVIFFRHGKDEQDFVGPSYTFAFIDEAQEITLNIMLFILSRVRHEYLPTQVFFTGNTNGHDWMYKMFKVNQDLLDADDPAADKTMRIIETVTFDNTKLSPAYIRYLDVVKAQSPSLYRRKVLASWEEPEGLVYEEFGNIHLLDERHFTVPEHGAKIRGMDYGGTNMNFTVWVYVDADYNHFVYKEHVGLAGDQPDGTYRQNVVKENAADVLRMSRFWVPELGEWQQENYSGSYLDPTAFHKNKESDDIRCSVADLFEDEGLIFEEGTRDKNGGIAHLKNLIHVDRDHKHPVTGESPAPRLYIMKCCPTLIRQMRELMYERLPERMEGKKNRPEKVRKHEDHGPDALMYACSSKPFPITFAPRWKTGTFMDAVRELEGISYEDAQDMPEIFYNPTVKHGHFHVSTWGGR